MKKIKDKNLNFMTLTEASRIFSLIYLASEYGKNRLFKQDSIFNWINYKLDQVMFEKIKKGYLYKDELITSLIDYIDKKKPVNLSYRYANDAEKNLTIVFSLTAFGKEKFTNKMMSTHNFILAFHLNKSKSSHVLLNLPKSVTKNTLKLLNALTKNGKKYYFEDFEKYLNEQSFYQLKGYFDIENNFNKSFVKRFSKLKKKEQRKLSNTVYLKAI